jgi:hypothetical protein
MDYSKSTTCDNSQIVLSNQSDGLFFITIIDGTYMTRGSAVLVIDTQTDVDAPTEDIKSATQERPSSQNGTRNSLPRSMLFVSHG